jgi:hypothetical protein
MRMIVDSLVQHRGARAGDLIRAPQHCFRLTGNSAPQRRPCLAIHETLACPEATVRWFPKSALLSSET